MRARYADSSMGKGRFERDAALAFTPCCSRPRRGRAEVTDLGYSVDANNAATIASRSAASAPRATGFAARAYQ